MGNMVKASYKEVDIEDFIWGGITNGRTSRRGLPLTSSRFYRQFSLPGCGVIDMLGIRLRPSFDGTVEKVVHVSVYELKRGSIDCNAVGQVSRYMIAICKNWDEIRLSLGLPDNYILTIEGILVGSGYDRDAKCMTDLSQNLSIYTFDVCWEEGLTFNLRDFYDNIMDIQIEAVKERLSSSKFLWFARPFVLARQDAKMYSNGSNDATDIPF